MKISASIVALTLTILAFARAVANVDAAERTPYPDVWGRELASAPGLVVNGFYLRDTGRGDYAMIYTSHSVDAEGNLKAGTDWARTDFFAGAMGPIAERAADDARRSLALPTPRVQSRGGIWLYLPGERQVKPFSREPKGVGCWVNYAGSLVLRDTSEKVLADKVVLRLLDAPERREYWNACQQARDSASYDARVDGLSFVLYPLRDGTFLAEGASSPFLIRFRPDLTSPFIDAHPNLFLVDTIEVDRIVKAAYAAADGFRIQAANDALYDYVMNLKKTRKSIKEGAE